MSDLPIHIFTQAGLKNLCGLRGTIYTGKLNIGTLEAETRLVDAYPRAMPKEEWWLIVDDYVIAAYQVPASDLPEERFCSTCWLLRSMMKANGITSRRTVRRLLRQQGGIK